MKDLNRTEIVYGFAQNSVASIAGALIAFCATKCFIIYIIILVAMATILFFMAYALYLKIKNIPDGTKNMSALGSLFLCIAVSAIMSILFMFFDEKAYNELIIVLLISGIALLVVVAIIYCFKDKLKKSNKGENDENR